MTIREYTLKLLEEAGCSLDCYRDEFGEKHALDDITDYAKDNEVPFPLEAVAKELIAIGNEQPIPPRNGHKQFCMIWENEHSCDGVEFDTEQEAKDDALNTLMEWLVDEQANWTVDNNGVPHPTNEQIESYDYMISNCYVCVVEWNEEAKAYGDTDYGWYPSSEEKNEINWLLWDELKKKYNW